MYTIRVRRNLCRSIIGFEGTAVLASTAPNIDGGVAFAPNGVLLTTRYSDNSINMIKPGSTMPDRVVSLTALGVAPSTGSLTFVPAGLPGAGRFKIASYSASLFYDATLVPDGNGTFDITNVVQTAVITGNPEGIAYIPPGSPGFPNAAMLVAEYGGGMVAAWDINANGDPIQGSRRVFIAGLSGAEGAFLDVTSGDFLFATYGGGNQVIVVHGFATNGRCDSIDFNNDGVFPDSGDIADFLSVFGGGACSNDPACGDLDFNNDCVSPDSGDIESFLRVFGGGVC